MAEIFNDLDLSRPYFEAVKRVSGNYTRTGYLSATSAPQPPQIAILERRYNDQIMIPVSRVLPAFIGTCLHNEIERSECEGYVQEKELVIDVDGVPFSGRPDFIFNNERIGDYKFTSTWGWVKGIKEEYLIQAHINSYLARRHNIPVTSAWIEFTFLDWSKGKGKYDRNYPPRSAKHFVDDLWSDTKTLDYIKSRIALHKSCESLPDDLLPECSPEERWLQDHCFAVIKKGGSRAVRGGIHGTIEEAEAFAKKKGRGHVIEERAGEARRCMDWCNAAAYCQQLKQQKED